VAGEWGQTEAGRRAKYYNLTAAGRRRLAHERRHWARVALAVTQVLEAE
jgi:DNA-binding PadR family transcriptional regulator